MSNSIYSKLYLGNTVRTGRAKCKTYANQAIKKATDTFRRIVRSPLSFKDKAKLVAAVGNPRGAFTFFSEIPSVNLVVSARSAAVQALWGDSRPLRCVENVMSILNDPCKHDPFFAGATKFLLDLGRILRKSLKLLAQFQQALNKRLDLTEQDIPFRDHGFMQHLFDMLLQLHLTIDRDMMLSHQTRPSISLLEQKSTGLKDLYRSYARFATLDSLSFRCERAFNQKITGGRTDMLGIHGEIDIVATRALKDRHSFSKKLEHLMVKLPKKDQPFSQEEKILDSILAGSICTNDRLFYMKHSKTQKCECGADKETPEHVFWTCPLAKYKAVKEDYMKEIKPLIKDFADQGRNVMESNAFRNAGIINESLPLLYSCAAKVDLPPNGPFEVQQTFYEYYDMEWWQWGYRRIFSDGGTEYPDEIRRQRSVFAVFYGFKHVLNHAEQVSGIDQTPYRAELLGVIYGIETADVPTWITLDNEAVANTAEMIVRWHAVSFKHINCSPLWVRLEQAVKKRPYGFFKISWIKGHLDLAENKAYLEEGIFTEQEKYWHVQVDILATQKQQSTRASVDTNTDANLTIKLCMLVQSMYIKLWAIRSLSFNEKALEANGQEQLHPPTHPFGSHNT